MVEDAAPMRKLVESVEMFVSPLGFPSEEGLFSPHVTLARQGPQARPEDQREDTGHAGG
jgi:2'-5' RNA ligase